MLAKTGAAQRHEYVLPEMAALYNHRTDMVTDMIQRHFKGCGITLHKPGTGTDGKRAVIEVGFHSLRHTFVSLCRESNAPLAVVESIVGHSNPSMTRHYTHVGELAAGRAVALLPSVMTEAAPAPAPREPSEILIAVQALLESMTAENWSKNKSEALAKLAKK